MNNKAVSDIVLALLLIGTLTFRVQRVQAEPTSIIVPEDYPTIQEAIDAASAGDTIIVREGLYAEGEIVVHKPLTLMAEGTVTVDGLQTARVFSVASDSVVMEGFIVKNGVYGIVLDSSDCRIEGNTVIDNLVGIHLQDSPTDMQASSYNIVRDNKVLNNSAGILVGTLLSRPYRCKYNTLEGNIVDNNMYGIGLLHSSHNVVKGNKVTQNTGLWGGIYLIFSHRNTINENTASDNFEYGILVLYSDYNIVNENAVNRNTHYGISLYSARGNNLKENVVKENEYGIASIEWSSACNTIKENKVLHNKEFDLYWDGYGNNIWIENRYKTRTDNIVQEKP